ncbi:hypothetical protein FACS1894203_3070 [Bacteroidia bacterium]|nr:hypothetical protein FACS1894203_3070 [Bacteroidia bacterium]
MGKFDPYKVDLKNMTNNVQEIEYLLENKFFGDIGGDDIQKGKVKVNLTVKESAGVYELNFVIDGTIIIPCDRCLDDMDFPVTTTNRLIVKLGKDYSEESDEIVIIPESEGVINLAWFIYEFIVLTIPIKHVHAPGKCNKTMTSTLKKHTPKGMDDEFGGEGDAGDIIITDSDADDTEDVIDPRWDALKGLKEENDNN